MNEETRFPFHQAHEIASKVLDMIRPHCIRCEIAGSIRRQLNFVKDIEIVAIPKPYQIGLFEDGLAAVVNQWQKVKGEMEFGKTRYTQRILPEGIKLDLFLAEPGNWGLIFAIRTGSADYSHKVLASAWVARGYHSEGGYLKQNGKTYDVLEEKDLFQRLSIPYIEPRFRNI